MKTNRQLLDEQTRLEERLHDVSQAIDTMRAIWREVCQQLAAVETEWRRRCDNTEIVIADESKMDDMVRRAEAGELAMRVDVADFDGETA